MDHIRKCISTLRAAKDNLKYEVFIVDNDSSDGSEDFLNSLNGNKQYRIILNKINVGFAKANNQAM